MKLITLFSLSLAMFLTSCSSDIANSPKENDFSIGNFSDERTDITVKSDYEKVITKALVKPDDYKFIVEGTIEYSLNNETVAIIDFGDGTYDDIATKTVDNEVFEFSLSEKKDKYKKNILIPLVFCEDCGYIIEGTIEYLDLKNNEWLATVNYGSGECDSLATKTWPGGSKVFTLKPKN